MNLDRLYPDLVPAPPAGEDVLGVAVGHGVWARLVLAPESPAAAAVAVTADQLRATGMTPEDARARALDNLARFAEESPELSIQVLGNPGDPAHFLLYSDHPRAAACLLLPDLYEEACERLETTEACAVVPQRESLVILPTRDRAFREGLVAKLREWEADAAHPISFALFELTPDGVREFHER